MKPPKILLLAQNPKTERNVEDPLEGTRSGRTVKAWLRAIGSPDVLVLNASRKTGKVTWKDYDVATVSVALQECDKFVALGTYASGLLERLGVPHFTLPHPPGLNRNNDNTKELERLLALCRTYVGGTN